MTMFKTISAGFALLLFATAAAAQPNYSGAWHSLAERSSWSDGSFPKGFSLTIDLKFEDNKLVYRSANDTSKDAVLHLGWSAPLDGTIASVSGQPRFNQVSVKPLGPNQYQILEMKDGDVIVGSIWTFLPDKKTFVRWGVGKSPAGVSRAFIEYFARQ
jgi:hypothetical protein